MIIEKINIVYFSATGTTCKVVNEIATGIDIKQRQTYKLLNNTDETILLPENEIVIFGIPVFSGRVPEIAKKALNKIRGNQTPAIITCVYGNRDFDDGLIELNDIVSNNGFRVISAAAFIAQHSIFPKVGYGRPDDEDLKIIRNFGKQSLNKYLNGNILEIKITGDHTPYREIKKIPLLPKTDRKKCNKCGLCVKECPVQAIDKYKVNKVDKQICIKCAHCIYICPQKAKFFGGLIYSIAKNKFEKKFIGRKEPYIVYYL